MSIVADIYFANRNIAGKEILWTAIGFAALLVSLWNLRDARRYIRDAHKTTHYLNGELTAIAKGHVRNELLRMTVDASIIYIGAASMFQYTPKGLPPWSPFVWGFIVAMYVIPVVMLVKSGADAYMRHNLAKGKYSKHA